MCRNNRFSAFNALFAAEFTEAIRACCANRVWTGPRPDRCAHIAGAIALNVIADAVRKLAIQGSGPAALGRILQVSRKREFDCDTEHSCQSPYGDVRRFALSKFSGALREFSPPRSVCGQSTGLAPEVGA